MATGGASTAAAGAAVGAEAHGAQQRGLPLVILMFFAWGFFTVLIDTLIPKLESVFALT